MAPHIFSSRFLPRGAVNFAQAAGFSLVLATFASQAPAQPAPATPAIADAPTVPPAAIVKEPLQPAASQEIVDERPSPQHVWIGGHWRWQDGNYVWVASHWELPPSANASWVEPRWEKKGNGYVLAGGYWQEAVAPAPVATPTTPAPEVVVVREAPPPPAREYIIERPSPNHVWIGGYWTWRLGRHVWVSGRWELPPRANVVWVAPRWEFRGNGYVFLEGYWQEATPVRVEGGPREMVVVVAPPPPRHERHGPPPSPYHVWIAGYWTWHDNRHVWLSGHWEQPPHLHATWIEPRWERRGNGYVFIEGVWR